MIKLLINKFKILFLIIIYGLLFSSCSTVQEAFDPEKNNSEEFLIEKKSPLSMPTDFDKLPLPQNEQTNDQNQSDDIETLITNSQADNNENKSIENKEIPGIVFAISRYGKIVYKKALGMQDPQKNIPMSEDSIFRIYSMTKPIVSTGIMLLNEDGVLYLNENLDSYIKDFQNMTVSTEKKINGKLTENLVISKNKIKKKII